MSVMQHLQIDHQYRRLLLCTLNSSSEWWNRNIMMTSFSPLLNFCAGNSPVTGEFHAQRPVTRSIDALLDLCLNKRLSKQSWGWWFETPAPPEWRHCNVPRWLGPYHGCWYGYSLCCQIIGSHGIEYARYKGARCSTRKDFKYMCHLIHTNYE